MLADDWSGFDRMRYPLTIMEQDMPRRWHMAVGEGLPMFCWHDKPPN